VKKKKEDHIGRATKLRDESADMSRIIGSAIWIVRTFQYRIKSINSSDVRSNHD